MITFLKKPVAYVGLPLMFGLIAADFDAKAQPPAQQQQQQPGGGIKYTILKLLTVSSSASATDAAYLANYVTGVGHRVVWPRDWQRFGVAEEWRDREEQPVTFALYTRGLPTTT